MKKRIIFLSPGPCFQIDSLLYENLSRNYHGDIITSSSKSLIIKTKKVSIFNLYCIKFDYKHQIYFNLKFTLFCFFISFKYRIINKKIDLVVTCDPLKAGIIGSLMSFILRAKFAPEVNGIFTSSIVYEDENNFFIRRLKSKIYPKIEGMVLKYADGIKILFPTQLDSFGEKITNNKKIHCVFAPVRIDKFLILSNEKEKKEILFIGFPLKLKGVDILIQAFKNISNKYPDWKLKILGWVPQLTDLMTMINEHPKIYYHPPVQPDEIPRHMEICSIFVLPSRSEAMGRVLVEAMASGKARIGSNVGGIPTVINNGIDGLLFESENVKDLADKLEIIINNPELRKRFGNAGRQRALRDFSYERYINNITNFYNDVLN